MVGSYPPKKLPIHWLATVGFAISIVGLALAWYGSLVAEKHLPHSPLREARGSAGLPADPSTWNEKIWDRAEVSIFGERFDRKVLEITSNSRIARVALQGVAFFLPLALGLAATYLGATAIKRIEQSGGKYGGNFQAVFAIMIGGFASVIAGCMILSMYAWPYVPSLYTR
jgi:hypothetical protein